jgi:hypothetical protein
MLAILHPPNAIVGGKVLAVLLEVDRGKHDGRNAEEREQ